MIKILTVVGARPQFVKAATLSRCIARYFSDEIEEIILHSGQHYDRNMSEQFFEELKIPQPKYQFNIGEIHHVDKVSQMKNNIELAIQNENPDLVILFGDTNTTLAGTYAASNLNIPIAHIEAGLRSFDESMPEEFNRYTCDHASTFLFAPTEKAFQNLIEEGASGKNKKPFNSENPALYLSGDILFDSFLYTLEQIEDTESMLNKYSLQKENFILATIHRNFNTDNPKRLNNIFESLDFLSKEKNSKIIIPLHPRTKNQLSKQLNKKLEEKLNLNPNILLIDPITHKEILALGIQSKMIITDSGGLQKEAFFMKKPCLIPRSNSEWTEIIETGTALLVDDDKQKLLDGYDYFQYKNDLNFPNLFGNGQTAKFICKKIIKSF